jgi:hypothetical protein
VKIIILCAEEWSEEREFVELPIINSLDNLGRQCSHNCRFQSLGLRSDAGMCGRAGKSAWK